MHTGAVYARARVCGGVLVRKCHLVVCGGGVLAVSYMAFLSGNRKINISSFFASTPRVIAITSN
jgi:hypothetical protein